MPGQANARATANRERSDHPFPINQRWIEAIVKLTTFALAVVTLMAANKASADAMFELSQRDEAKALELMQAQMRLRCHELVLQFQADGTILDIQWPRDHLNPTIIVGRPYTRLADSSDFIPHTVNCVLTGSEPDKCIDIDIRDRRGELVNQWRECKLKE